MYQIPKLFILYPTDQIQFILYEIVDVALKESKVKADN